MILPSLLSVILLPILFILPCYGGDFIGLVVSVKDGDTIEVLHNKRAEPIRLTGIDCPEKK